MVGICTCVAGQTASVCKHQLAAAEASMSLLPQQYVPNEKTRKLLAEVAMGDKNNANLVCLEENVHWARMVENRTVCQRRRLSVLTIYH